jgi:uroporphyrin-3 C-methyltransferase
VNTEIPENESEVPESSGPDNPEPDLSGQRRPDPDVAETPGAVREAEPRRRGFALSFLSFLIALTALLGTAWMWWQDQASQGLEEARVFNEIARLERNDSEVSLKLSQIRDEVDTLLSGDMGAEFDALQKRIETDRSKMSEVEQTIREQMALSRSLQAATDSMQGRLLAAEAAVTGMSNRELDAGGELDLAEVDYLLRLANERLKLFSDPGAADQALEVADMHLAAIDNPMYLGVRQDIAAARRDLASLEIPDYLEIANELDSIQQSIAELPFKGEEVVARAAGQVEGESWWEKVKSVFSNLVTVRRSTDQENERISLQDKDFIRQRVWLQLEIAHLSLMRRDQQAFRSSLERVQQSMSEWFDPADARFQSANQVINELLAIEVQVEVPDITAPWSTLRLLRGSQSEPTPPSPVADGTPGEISVEVPVDESASEDDGE